MNRWMQTLWVSVGGAVVVALYAVLAALQLLVWTPLAVVPGASLAEIRAEVHAAEESLNEVSTLIILGVGVLGAVVAAAVSVRAKAHPAIPAMTFLSLLMLGGPGFFIASFGPGMALADTFGVSAGIHAPGVLPFYVVSALAGVLLLVGVVVAAVRTRRETRVQMSAG